MWAKRATFAKNENSQRFWGWFFCERNEVRLMKIKIADFLNFHKSSWSRILCEQSELRFFKSEFHIRFLYERSELHLFKNPTRIISINFTLIVASLRRNRSTRLKKFIWANKRTQIKPQHFSTNQGFDTNLPTTRSKETLNPERKWPFWKIFTWLLGDYLIYCARMSWCCD